jgi:hypothetical protein
VIRGFRPGEVVHVTLANIASGEQVPGGVAVVSVPPEFLDEGSVHVDVDLDEMDTATETESDASSGGWTDPEVDETTPTDVCACRERGAGRRMVAAGRAARVAEAAAVRPWLRRTIHTLVPTALTVLIVAPLFAGRSGPRSRGRGASSACCRRGTCTRRTRQRSHSYLSVKAELADGTTVPLDEAIQAETAWGAVWDWQKRRTDMWRFYAVTQADRRNINRTWYLRGLCVREERARGVGAGPHRRRASEAQVHGAGEGAGGGAGAVGADPRVRAGDPLQRLAGARDDRGGPAAPRAGERAAAAGPGCAGEQVRHDGGSDLAAPRA